MLFVKVVVERIGFDKEEEDTRTSITDLDLRNPSKKRQRGIRGICSPMISRQIVLILYTVVKVNVTGTGLGP